MTTAPKIGRRTALWRALGQELQRRNRLSLPFPDFDHNQLANQIAAAGYREDLWLQNPSDLAAAILDRPYKIPERDEIFQLELSIVYRELAADWDEEINFLMEAFSHQPMEPRFQGRGIDF